MFDETPYCIASVSFPALQINTQFSIHITRTRLPSANAIRHSTQENCEVRAYSAFVALQMNNHKDG